MSRPGYDWRRDPYRSIVPPIYLGVAYGFDNVEMGAKTFSKEWDCFAYTRMGNPPIREFCDWLTAMEGGAQTFATNSGMAATQLLVMALTTKKKKIVTSPFIYGGTYHYFDLLVKKQGWPIVFVENAFDPGSWEKAIDKDTAFVFLETPANPRLDVFDISAVAEIAHRKNTWLVVDNTIATPVLQKPLEFGADAVLHSVTKYLIRQSVGLGGALVCGKRFNEKFGEDLYDWFVHLGVVMHPLSAFFVLNGSETLEKDMEDFSENAKRVGGFLNGSPKIKNVYYPLNPASPQFDLARKQMPKGGSGVLAFETHNFRSATKLVESLQEIILAPHLGDIRSLIIHPASTTHSKLSKTALAKVGIPPTLIRLSVGRGKVQKILGDLERAIDKI